jgi:transposase
MNIRWIVQLSEEERALLEDLLSGGTLGARKFKRVLILLRSDDGWTASEIAAALDCGTATVHRQRKRYVEAGLPEALDEEHRPGAERKLNALQEATLVALACSDPPAGRAKWTMQLLSDELIILTDVDDLSAETVRRRLNEKKLKPWQRKMWCIASVDAEFVTRMEDILALYAEPYDPRFPVVNFDETPVQLIGETRIPIAAAPGRSACVDYEYRRHGTANLFITFDQHRGWRHVEVTKRRTLDDFAEQMQALVDIHYPQAQRIRVVLDNLNTHRVSALYERFEPEVARRLASRLEFHFTPKHASWLNMVEIEISVLSKQCLDRRIPSIDLLTSEVNTWQKARNTEKATIDWLFDVEDARRKLGRQYPVPTSRPKESEDFRMDETCSTSGPECEPQAAPVELSFEMPTTRSRTALARLWHGLHGRIRHISTARGAENV